MLWNTNIKKEQLLLYFLLVFSGLLAFSMLFLVYKIYVLELNQQELLTKLNSLILSVDDIQKKLSIIEAAAAKKKSEQETVPYFFFRPEDLQPFFKILAFVGLSLFFGRFIGLVSASADPSRFDASLRRIYSPSYSDRPFTIEGVDYVARVYENQTLKIYTKYQGAYIDLADVFSATPEVYDNFLRALGY